MPKQTLPLFLETNSRRYVDVLHVLLIHSGRYELLPELYEIFGRETLFRFLELFGGTTIKVPSETEIKKAARDVDIYCRITDAAADHRDEVITVLAREHDLTETWVRAIHDEMRKLMDSYDLRRIIG